MSRLSIKEGWNTSSTTTKDTTSTSFSDKQSGLGGSNTSGTRTSTSSSGSSSDIRKKTSSSSGSSGSTQNTNVVTSQIGTKPISQIMTDVSKQAQSSPTVSAKTSTKDTTSTSFSDKQSGLGGSSTSGTTTSSTSSKPEVATTSPVNIGKEPLRQQLERKVSPSYTESPYSPKITSSEQIQRSQMQNTIRQTGQLKDIDPTKQYIYNDKIVYGAYVQARELENIVRQTSRNISTVKPGGYIQKDGQYYHITPELQYMLSYTDPKQRQALIGSIGTESYEKRYVDAYEKLTKEEKAGYNLKYLDWTQVPTEDIKYYPGGETYLKENKESVVDRFIKESGGYEKYKMSIDPGLLAYRVAATNDAKVTESDIREFAYESLRFTPIGQKEYYFGKLPEPAKIYSSTFHSTASASLFPITLPQMATKYFTGTGTATDVIGRIQKGHTYLPDVGKYLEKHQPGGPQGLIGTGISEGVAYATGSESNAWERFTKNPLSGIAATGGEIVGALIGGYGWSKGKDLLKTGLYKVGSPVKSFFVSKNIMKDLPLSRYRPTNLLRTAYWKGRTKLGIAEYVPEENVWDPRVLYGFEKFAKADNVDDMVNYFNKTINASGEISGIHASPGRFKLFSRIGSGSSETPGLSVSAYGKGSPHFLGIGKTGYISSNYSGVSLFPKLHLPTGVVFKIKNIFRLPKSLRNLKTGESTTQYYNRVGNYLKSQERGSYATIAAKAEIGGPEIEGIITSGTWAKRMGNYYWTTFKGQTIPLPEYGLLGSGLPEGAINVAGNTITSKIKEFVHPFSSTGSQTIPLIRPSYLISKIPSSFSSLQTPTYTPSSIPSSVLKITPISSYKPSSYNPSKIISFSSYKSSFSPSKSSFASSLSSGSSSSSLSPSSSQSSIKSIPSSPLSSSLPSSPFSPSSTPSYPYSPFSPISKPSIPSPVSTPSSPIKPYILTSPPPPFSYKKYYNAKPLKKTWKQPTSLLGYRERRFNVMKIEDIIGV